MEKRLIVCFLRLQWARLLKMWIAILVQVHFLYFILLLISLVKGNNGNPFAFYPIILIKNSFIFLICIDTDKVSTNTFECNTMLIENQLNEAGEKTLVETTTTSNLNYFITFFLFLFFGKVLTKKMTLEINKQLF